MAKGLNKVMLIGNLGADPEVRYAANGNAIANVRMATSSVRKDQAGQVIEMVEWHRVVFFGRLAEIVQQYLRKGSQIYVEGRLQTRKWQDQSGQDRYTTEIVASEMQMLGSRQNGQQAAQERPVQQKMAAQGGGAPAPAVNEGPAEDDDIYDDIPF